MGLLFEKTCASAAAYLTRFAIDRRVPEDKRLWMLARCLGVKPRGVNHATFTCVDITERKGMSFIQIPTRNDDGKIETYSIVDILCALAKREIQTKE